MPKRKFKKKELQVIIRKLFEKHPDHEYSVKEILKILHISDKNIHKLTITILTSLKKEGFLLEYQRGIFISNKKYQSNYIGVVDGTAHGGAYIIVPELSEDIYVPKNRMENALDGDTVEVAIIHQGKRRVEGAIVEVVQRKTTQFVGTVEIKNKFAFLKIDNSKINIALYIPLGKLKGAKNNEKAVARITSWPLGVGNPFGEIIKVLGNPGEIETEMISILMKNNFEPEFPKEIKKTAKNISIDLDQNEIKNRRDCRETLTFTIDPEDAKDFDDALSFKELENGNYEIGVHIADVSHYVPIDSPIDKEAYQRGNSVYLEDRVIPMLPKELSNFACSLRPEEDKFAFSVIFELNKNGKILQEWMGKTVIRSNRRLTYEEAQNIIKGKEDKLKIPIITLDKIAKKIREKRLKNGALAIESDEMRFVLDENGNPVKVVKTISEDAHKLIEEFMLLANKQVALFVGKLPNNKGSSNQFIYRCHDQPAIEKLNTFSVFIDKFGYDLAFKDLNNVAQKINSFLAEIRKTPEYDLIQSMIIRSMAKAEYQTNNIGHYGLAFDYYTHFTSPIRRYADLMVHRILLDKLENKQVNYGNRLNEISKHVSAQERKAIDAERESNKFFQAKYLSDKIGETFTGTISGLADFGFFVKLNDNHCEGLVSIHSLIDDSYYFDIEKFQITGRHTRYKFNFGDKVEVKVKGVYLEKKQIDFELIS